MPQGQAGHREHRPPPLVPRAWGSTRQAHGKGLRELQAHATREAVANRKGKLRATHASVDGVNDLEVPQMREPAILAVAHAQPVLVELAVGDCDGVDHARSPQTTLATPSVGHTPQPTQESRVQSGVVTPWAARRHSR